MVRKGRNCRRKNRPKCGKMNVLKMYEWLSHRKMMIKSSFFNVQIYIGDSRVENYKVLFPDKLCL